MITLGIERHCSHCIHWTHKPGLTKGEIDLMEGIDIAYLLSKCEFRWSPYLSKEWLRLWFESGERGGDPLGQFAWDCERYESNMKRGRPQK